MKRAHCVQNTLVTRHDMNTNTLNLLALGIPDMYFVELIKNKTKQLQKSPTNIFGILFLNPHNLFQTFPFKI